jgi:hypothetical protein
MSYEEMTGQIMPQTGIYLHGSLSSEVIHNSSINRSIFIVLNVSDSTRSPYNFFTIKAQLDDEPVVYKTRMCHIIITNIVISASRKWELIAHSSNEGE